MRRWLEGIQAWLRDSRCHGCLTSAELDWIREADTNIWNLVKPLRVAHAQQWLRGRFWDPILCGTNTCHETTIGSDEQSKFGQSPTLDSSPREMIEVVARSYMFEEDALWHERLAIAIQDEDEEWLEAALPHYEPAVMLDPRRWASRPWIAAFKHNKNDTKAAVALLEENERMMKDEIKKQGSELPNKTDYSRVRRAHVASAAELPLVFQEDLVRTLTLLVECYQTLEDDDEAYAWSQKLANVDGSYKAADQYLMIAYQSGKPVDALKFIKQLDQDIDIAIAGISRLVEYLSKEYMYDDFFPILCDWAVEERTDVDWLKKVYFRAIRAAKRAHNVMVTLGLEVCLADLHYRTHDIEQTLRAWDRILDWTRTYVNTTGGQGGQCQHHVRDRYLQLLLR